MSVEVRSEAVRRTLAALPVRLAVNLRGALEKSGQEHTREVTLRSFRGYTGSKGDKLQNRSRSLALSFGSQPFGSTLSDIGVRTYSSGVKYARIQEHGGRVTPKNARNLTIPLRAALTGSGVPRFSSARDLIEQYQERAFFFRAKDGKVYLALRDPEGAVAKGADKGRFGKRRTRISLMYQLVKGVTIPPRLGFRKAWDDLAPKRQERLAKAARTAVSEAVAGG